jgi:arsenite methyltransferase
VVAILGFSRAKVLEAVRAMYTQVAAEPEQPFHFPVGRGACERLGYAPELLDGVPEGVLQSFAGVGCPFRAGVVRAADTVLDVGSGSGTDALIATRLVGPEGKVYALDMTAAMSQKLRRLAREAGVRNLEVVEGNAEAIPLANASIDLVTSNGVLNLVPDKRRAIREIFRVLKPSGRVQLADIVIRRPVTWDCKADPSLWAECVVGATVDEEYLALFREAGFEDVRVLRDFDYFALSPSAETREVAERFGARAVEIAMTRPAGELAVLHRFAHRFDPRRMLRSIRRRGLAGALALGGAMLACYGSVAAAALLSLAGITLAVNEAAVAGVIVALVALAAIALAAAIRTHGRWWPSSIAFAGAGLVAYTHATTFSYAVEFAGFALVGLAIWLDQRARMTAAPVRRDPES